MVADIGAIAQSAGTGALNIGLVLIVIMVGFGAVWGIIWLYGINRRYSQFKLVIWTKDSFGHIRERYGKAGIFVDKATANKRFFIKKGIGIVPDVGLDADKVPVIYNFKGKKIVYLYQYGEKNYSFIQIKDISRESGFKIIVGEEDVNWAVNAYERQKKLFQQSTLMQYMPFIVLAFVSLVILIIFIYFFKDFDTLRQTGVALRDTAIALQHLQNATIMPIV